MGLGRTLAVIPGCSPLSAAFARRGCLDSHRPMEGRQICTLHVDRKPGQPSKSVLEVLLLDPLGFVELTGLWGMVDALLLAAVARSCDSRNSLDGLHWTPARSHNPHFRRIELKPLAKEQQRWSNTIDRRVG